MILVTYCDIFQVAQAGNIYWIYSYILWLCGDVEAMQSLANMICNMASVFGIMAMRCGLSCGHKVEPFTY